jgi:hypothetical protein
MRAGQRCLVLALLLVPGVAAGQGYHAGDIRIDPRDVRVCNRSGCVAAGDALAAEIQRALNAEAAIAVQLQASGDINALAHSQRDATVPLSTATALTFASHNNRRLYLKSGAALSVAWADTGDGFSTVILNRSGGPIAVTTSGFTGGTPINTLGSAIITANGTAVINVVSPDGGVTRECWLTGDLGP